MKLAPVAMALALALPFAATAQTYPASPSTVAAPASASSAAEAHTLHRKTFLGALKGGGIGCAAGALFGILRHDNPIKGCLVAGAAGAVVGGVVAYKHQVRDARKLAAAARAAGGSAELQTETVNAKASDGSTQQAVAMKSMTLNLNAAGVARRDANTKAVLAQAAQLAQSSARPITITVYGSAAQQDWMAQQIRANYPNAQIDSRNGDSPRLVLAA